MMDLNRFPGQERGEVKMRDGNEPQACPAFLPQRAASLTWAAAGAVLVAEVSAVVVPVAGPVVRDAPPAGALELGVGAGVHAAVLVAAVPAVVVCTQGAGRGLGQRPSLLVLESRGVRWLLFSP